MPRKQTKKPSSGVNIGGNVYTGGGDIAGGDVKKGSVHQSHGLSTSEIRNLFLPIYQTIDQKKTLSPDDQDDLKLMVKEIEGEATKGRQANETLVGRHLRNIARMAPDILDVTLKTVANPILGLATVAQKISGKASNEQSSAQPDEKKKDLPS